MPANVVSWRCHQWSGLALPSVQWAGIATSGVEWSGLTLPSVQWASVAVSEVNWCCHQCSGLVLPSMEWVGIAISGVGWHKPNAILPPLPHSLELALNFLTPHFPHLQTMASNNTGFQFLGLKWSINKKNKTRTGQIIYKAECNMRTPIV